jgi:hypothetical protein
VLAVGRGGRDAEAHRPSWRLPPLTSTDVAELADAALVPVIRAVEALLLAHPSISEIDVNPVRVLPSGAVALDALVRRREEA